MSLDKNLNMAAEADIFGNNAVAENVYEYLIGITDADPARLTQYKNKKFILEQTQLTQQHSSTLSNILLTCNQ